MKIQVVTFKKEDINNITSKNVRINNIDEAESFDDYDYNIIDLTNKLIWEFRDSYHLILFREKGINYLKQMINSTISKIFIVLPGNIDIKYDYSNAVSMFRKNTLLKNIEERYLTALGRYFIDYIGNYSIHFEKNKKTLRNKKEYKSDFYFEQSTGLGTITPLITTDNNNKGIVLNLGNNDNIYISTLYTLAEGDIVTNILEGVFGLVEHDEPEWVKDVNFYTDQELQEANLRCEAQIDELKKQIETNNKALEKNKQYKKILYTNGDILVEKVTDILEQMFKCDCSNFVDEKKEDLRIKHNGKTYLFEIKGENDGIKKSNISQLVTHMEEYEEKLEKDGDPKEEIKGILIKNEFKNRSVNVREPVHHDVIQRASSNNCLIITSKLLLNLFEKFLRNEIQNDQVIEMMNNQTGLLNLDN